MQVESVVLETKHLLQLFLKTDINFNTIFIPEVAILWQAEPWKGRINV